ncbi:MAG: hypothetical protein ACI8W3_003893 [Myxococcota bacterium]|jgi:hypothetical protein
MTTKRKAPLKGIDLVRAIALTLPDVEEGTSYGTNAFLLRKKLLARLQDDPNVLVLSTAPDTRDMLLDAYPKQFFVTDHYRGQSYVLVNLKTVSKALLNDLLEQAWRRAASARQIKQFDSASQRVRR